MTKFLEEQLRAEFPDFFIDLYGPMETTCMHYGIGCEDGWFYLIRNACVRINREVTPQTFKFEQIKQKFDKLVIHWNRPDMLKYPGVVEKIESIIADAERASLAINEKTGLPLAKPK